MAQHSRHDSAYTVQAPTHPVSQLQGPFEESMLEAVDDEPEDIYLDPITRRNTLLEAPIYTRVVAGRWKQKHGEQFHPLWKLIAQISFGIHLLAQGMAKSEDEVMQILQAHVDEIDGFLERTTEDFDLAQEDIQERLRCLKLPLSHPATFDKMLEDRNFRLSIVEGNEKIEHIVERTSQAMKDSLKDVQKGFDSTSCLETYLQGLSATWQRQSVEHEAVFVAMLGNVEGWRKAFMSLHMQGNKLGGSLKKLTDIINEMQARAGEVSRRLLHQARVQHQQVMGRPTGKNTPTSRFQGTPNKQLPTIHNRPAMRHAASHDTARSTPTMRTSSQDSLRQQALLGRSQTPQHDMPAPRNVGNAASPRIIQIGSNSQARVHSMVPSLMEAATHSGETLVTPQPRMIHEEEQAERYFPPVELPAHVPEETMRTVPMSKQNRLSIGLGLVPPGKAEKRNSRLGTSALVDLLRSAPTPNQPLEIGTSESADLSWRASTGLVKDSSSADKTAASNTTSPRPSSHSDTTSKHANNSRNGPKKGARQWVGAPEKPSLEHGKFAAEEYPSSQVVTIAVPREQNTEERGSGPSTPSWAVTTFAQVEKKKELLKKGAFSSHPPDVPLGSPPLAQHSLQNPLGVAQPQRRPSHASSTGHTSLGEPGPEIAASEAGSASGQSIRHNQASRRASAYAPEVVIEKVPPLPVTKKQYFAEMEGSSPEIPGMQQSASSIRDVVMELEAPQQYFKLPPRPKPAGWTSAVEAVNTSEVLAGQNTNLPSQSIDHAGTAELGAYQQHFRLPPRPQSTSPLLTTQVSALSQPAGQAQAHREEAREQIIDGQVQSLPPGPMDTIQSQHIGQTSLPTEDLPRVDLEPEQTENSTHVKSPSTSLHIQVDTEQFADLGVSRIRTSSKPLISTPNVPLPPSPYGDDNVEPTPEGPSHTSPPRESLYFLPALAYKPPSPRLPPDPTRSAREPEPVSGPETGPPCPQPVVEAAASPQTEPVWKPTIDAKAEEASPALSSTSRLSSAKSEDVFYSAEDHNRQPATLTEQDATMSTTASAKSSLQRDHKPAQLTQTLDTGSADAPNPWKAFFTGQPSPVGSNLSIRSIKRESILEQRPHSRGSPQSPALLSPASASSRHPFPPSPVTSPDVAGSAKETIWNDKTNGEIRRSSLNHSISHESEPSAAQETKIEGLGITT